MINIRYENSFNHFPAKPLELGLRHLKVACCDGSQKTLLQLARDKIIYRPRASNHDTYEALTYKQRFSHAIIGLSETIGYATLIAPFAIAATDKFFNKPWYPKGGNAFRTHMEEGGNVDARREDWRKSPFDSDAMQDPFYQSNGAIHSHIDSLTVKAQLFANQWSAGVDFFGSKEECSTNVFVYIKDILNDPHFQNNPQAFLRDWKLERGQTEEFRIPEDAARAFFERTLLPPLTP